MRASRSPAFIVTAVAAAGLLMILLTVLIACRQPYLGLSFAAGGNGRTLELAAVDADGPARALPLPARLRAIAAADGRRMALAPSDLLDDPDVIETYDALDGFYARQSALADLLAAGPLRLEVQRPDGAVAEIPVQPARRSLGDLPAPFWVQLLVGLVALVIGGWVWALRPGDPATQLFALAGLGLAICLCPIAFYSAREIAVPGGLFQILLTVSVSGAWLMGAALIGLFLVYPARLAGPRAVALCFALCLSVPVLRLSRLAPTPLLLAQATAVIALMTLLTVIVLQWRATRHDPRQRAIVRWFGVSVGLGCAAFVAMVNMPLLLGIPAVIPQAYAVATFLLIYGGAALGVARYRLFMLDVLAFRILAFLGAGAFILSLDALLVFGLNVAAGPSLWLAALVLLLFYLPLRDYLWRLLARRPKTDRTRLFQLVTQAAFGSGGAGARWERLLRHLFDPLQIAPPETAPAAPRLREEGLVLELPAVAGSPPLALRHPRGGSGLFTEADARLAGEIVALLETVHRQRDAYERGVLSERLRIARDLHDDVGARLLSALHMAEDGTRPVLHAALDDIRTIVAGLGGERKPFGRVIADLRHETARRLEALGIALDWPSPHEAEADIPLSYSAYKNLSSAVRELMSNVMRHAGAARVSVRIACEPGRITAVIRDDGKGCQPAADGARRGNGLGNLTARMELLGGGFHFTSAPGGTEARFWFPLTPADTPEPGMPGNPQAVIVPP